jgi:diphosphomevalonate decarboxylase
MTKVNPGNLKSGTIGWSCPSNIALIKYWGKKPIQIPMNPSLSLTLTEARTITKISYTYKPESRVQNLHFTFEGKEAPTFEQRIRKYIDSILPLIPCLSNTSLEIESENTFPHSSGIASSASAMGALALCLVQLEEEVTGSKNHDQFWQKASLIARLGSGSASRSIYPQFALWGETEGYKLSSDQYAIPISGFHNSFVNLRDSILIVESGQKRVSSSAGHALMDANPYAKSRFKQARHNLDLLLAALKNGNWDQFITLMEEEALSLHAMMMTSKPGYLLMQAGTLSILHRIREFRRDTGYKLGFTLDAGANVHLLYPETEAAQVDRFIHAELMAYCENGKVIKDKMGPGPQKTEQ